MSTKKNARTGKGKLADLEPNRNPRAGAGYLKDSTDKVSMDDFHLTLNTVSPVVLTPTLKQL